MVTWNERSMPIVYLKEYYVSDGRRLPSAGQRIPGHASAEDLLSGHPRFSKTEGHRTAYGKPSLVGKQPL